jgi:sterol desaturase/sphingolipid hydroxylase (fatty acid hydroxylase superfamily)
MDVLDILKPFLGWQGPLAAAAIFVPLERFLPLRRQRVFRQGWKTDGAYIFINSVLYRFGFAALAAVLISVSGLHPLSWTSAFLARQPLWLEAIGAVIVGDFFLYWAHRALHRNKLLWRFHSIHHAVEKMDWVVSYHSHVIDEMILSGAAFGSVAFLGFSPAAIAIYAAVYSWISFAVHTNTRLTIGPLRRLIGSPEFHHWHHSNEVDVRDRNFASIISLWDFAFGTAYLPKGRKPTIYGIDDPMPSGYIGQLLHPFRESGPMEDNAAVPNRQF